MLFCNVLVVVCVSGFFRGRLGNGFSNIGYVLSFLLEDNEQPDAECSENDDARNGCSSKIVTHLYVIGLVAIEV